MWVVGQHVKIRAGVWARFQPVGAKPDKWERSQLSKPVRATIEAVGNDGWLIVVDVARQARYQVWPTVLEVVNGKN